MTNFDFLTLLFCVTFALTGRFFWLTSVDTMKPTFRKTDKGQIVFAILAHWVADRLTRSGKTLPEWAATGYKLSAIGINKRSAIAELKPRLPDAHTWYNAHGDSRTRGHYATFEDYWTVLFNRLFYFFHRHNEDGRGKLVPVVAEWPGQISQDGLSLIPPPIPYNCYPEDDGPTDDPPGTGYPEDDPPRPGDWEPVDRGGEVSRYT